MAGRFRLFVDESGDAQMKNVDDPASRYLGLTGVVIRLDRHDGSMSVALDALKEKHFPSHRPDKPVILHRVDLMRREGPFGVLKDPIRAGAWERDVLLFLDIWATHPITLVIDKLRARQMYGEKDDPYPRAMHYMLQRYRGILHYYYQGTGDVMFEMRGKNEDRRLAHSYSRLFEEGDQFLSAADLQAVLTSRELKLARKDENIPGLQVADLIANPARLSLLQEHRSVALMPETTSQRIIEVIRPRYHEANRRIFPPEP
jgi:hypothetical protein